MNELTLFRNKCITVAVTAYIFWLVTDWSFHFGILNFSFLAVT